MTPSHRRVLARLRNGAAGLAVAAAMLSPAASQGDDLSVGARDFWPAYKARFVDPGGRVIDNANGSISHSEGQGYGMLLAYLAGDEAAFRQIWRFTDRQLYVRPDGLAAWRWDPNATPPITDLNNATDGDILIAYALALAGEAWRDPSLTADATAIAEAIGRETIADNGTFTYILPGVWGFKATDRSDGPVVNISYWVFEAMPVLSRLAPAYPWEAVTSSGIALLDQSRTGPAELPPEWSSLGNRTPRPAAGFDRVFGYNAIRIPLYLMRSGLATPGLIAPFLRNRTANGSSAVVLLDTGATLEPLSDPGYRMVLAAADCAVNGTPVPGNLLTFEPVLYYSATLYLLSWFYLAEHRPACL
ncbi:MAG: endoglucanase [Bauldia sp.]|nr:endoglucanase [Bauldia sp.]